MRRGQAFLRFQRRMMDVLRGAGLALMTSIGHPTSPQKPRLRWDSAMLRSAGCRVANTVVFRIPTRPP
jgi:hypothetical protein